MFPRNAFLTPLLPPYENFNVYDLSVDPFEQNNIANEISAELLQELKDLFFVSLYLIKHLNSVTNPYVSLAELSHWS